jgi:hypothetical protein
MLVCAGNNGYVVVYRVIVHVGKENHALEIVMDDVAVFAFWLEKLEGLMDAAAVLPTTLPWPQGCMK